MPWCFWTCGEHPVVLHHMVNTLWFYISWWHPVVLHLMVNTLWFFITWWIPCGSTSHGEHNVVLHLMVNTLWFFITWWTPCGSSSHGEHPVVLHHMVNTLWFFITLWTPCGSSSHDEHPVVLHHIVNITLFIISWWTQCSCCLVFQKKVTIWRKYTDRFWQHCEQWRGRGYIMNSPNTYCGMQPVVLPQTYMHISPWFYRVNTSHPYMGSIAWPSLELNDGWKIMFLFEQSGKY